jgi:asparagine synthase (glutamine-hydrolysing)
MRHQRSRPAAGSSRESSEQQRLAGNFTSGMLSIAHEIDGQIALDMGVEPRSPYSDRRLVEFAIRMPLQARLFGPWYKQLLRDAFAGILPEPVRWQRGLGGHPGGEFHSGFIARMAGNKRDCWNLQRIEKTLAPWVDSATLRATWNGYRANADPSAGDIVSRLAVLALWLDTRRPALAAVSSARAIPAIEGVLHGHAV